MPRDRTPLVSLSAGILASAIALAYGLTTDYVQVLGVSAIPLGEEAVFLALAVAPFAVAAVATALALRHRVVLPLATTAGLTALPVLLDPSVRGVLIVVLGGGPLVVVVGLLETLGRARFGRLRAAPSAASFRAISLGVMAAVLYAGVFTIRAVLPMWRTQPGLLRPPPYSIELPFVLWYVLGAALVLVGVPVALHRRFDLLAPLVGLVAYLLVDLAYLQPLVAEGSDLAVVLLLAVWPTLAAVLAGAGAVEWWVRHRRGEYDEPEEGDEGGDGDGGSEGFTVEGGLFGDRV